MKVKILSRAEIYNNFPNILKKCACGCGMWKFNYHGENHLLESYTPFGEVVRIKNTNGDEDKFWCEYEGKCFSILKILTKNHLKTFVEVSNKSKCFISLHSEIKIY